MNRLQYETSPYLQQHKDNPVDWYPWGREALDRAAAEDKPILLSIGYSSCHWCHVMERESFTDEAVAAYMNEHFVNIKLDREERPDLDKIYMDAIVAITGSGGWPLNCFLTPDLRPFYGGTYYPPETIHQRPSWIQVLQHIQRIYTQQKDQVREQAGRLSNYLLNSGNTLLQLKPEQGTENMPPLEAGRKMALSLRARFDTVSGGFGQAPKFPATMSIQYLLDYFFYGGEQAYADHAFFTLDRMAQGGIYDQVRGGFARYATDRDWNIPHFEKMLYDNAQLLKLYSTAYKLRPSRLYAQVVEETAEWLIREMKSDSGGYYSAIDADSEHVEGKYYVWTYEELHSVLSGDQFELIKKVYGIRPEGNWEDPHHPQASPVNILWVSEAMRGDERLFSGELKEIKQKLCLEREKRVKPLTDTKLLISWNALLCQGFLEAWDVFQNPVFLDEARGILGFLSAHGMGPTGDYLHQKGSAIPAMLDDISYQGAAFLQAFRSLGEPQFLKQADKVLQYALTHYYDPQAKTFFYSKAAPDLIAPANDWYDNTTPSAVGTMAWNMVQYGRIMQMEYEKMGDEMIRNLRPSILRYPESLSQWASLLLSQSFGWMEIKVPDPAPADIRDILKTFIPLVILHREKEGGAGIDFCHNFSCELPVGSFPEFRLLLKNHYHPDEDH